MQIDRQDIFNRIVGHARSQNAKAVFSDNTCRYRVPNSTLKCFIGCLIPDEKYNPSMEGGLGYNPEQIFDAIFGSHEINREDYFFLKCLQSIHDVYPVSKWELKFTQFSKNYNLIMPD